MDVQGKQQTWEKEREQTANGSGHYYEAKAPVVRPDMRQSADKDDDTG